ncbi:MAG: helix-turn-helix domain-containing protein [Kineosporiaceae bacterium]
MTPGKSPDPQRTALLLTSPVRRAIVDHLAEAGAEDPDGLTAAQLAELLELHVTTVRFHLDQLVTAGLLTAADAKDAGVGRPRKLYRIAPGSLTSADDERARRMLIGLLADSFGEGGLTPAEAGRRWSRAHVAAESADEPADTAGRWLTKVGRMIDILADWGYTPEVASEEGGHTIRINLRRCPFIDLAHTNPAVVCGIHRGLIHGTLEQLGEPEAQVGLEPFVEPDLCRALVRTPTPFRSTARSTSNPRSSS